MRMDRSHNWMMIGIGLAIVFLTGCSMNLKEAAEAGFFDFVTGTITDSLTAIVPIADAISNAT